jgi:endonuclease/exonuclease/phosphatase family metal-dependent hydrolase
MNRNHPRRLGWLILGLAIVGLVLWIPNVSKPGDEAEGCLQGCAVTRSQDDGQLRVVSLNVLHDFPRYDSLPQRLDLVAGEILRLDADIVLLQEVPWTDGIGYGAKYLAERVGMNYVYLRANGNHNAIRFEEGEAILSAYPLKSPSFTELRPQAGYFQHRVVLHAVASTPEGELHLFVTHLSGEDAIGPGQVESLTAFTNEAEGPAILAGDFNALESSPQIVSLTSVWVDAYRAIHPHEAGYTSSVDDLHAGPEETLERRIDYMFVSPDLRLLDAQRFSDHPFPVDGGWLWVSDHIGLWIVIEIP